MKSWSHERAQDAMLQYLENTLSSEDRAAFEAHLDECPRCSEEIRDMQLLTQTLSEKGPEIFCPEVWELEEYAETGKDPLGTVASHLESCPSCREEISQQTAAGTPKEGPMPFWVKSVVRERFEAEFGKPPLEQKPGSLARIRKWLSSISMIPAMSLAGAAAALVVAILIWPRGDIEPVPALSDLQWKPLQLSFMGPSRSPVTPEPSAAPATRPRLAIVIFFQGFDERPSQDRIDLLYAALTPTRGMRKRYEFVPPARVKKALEERTIPPAQIPARLGKDLDLDMTLTITIDSRRDLCKLYGRLIDGKTGALRTERTADTPSDELAFTVKEIAASLLGNMPNAE